MSLPASIIVNVQTDVPPVISSQLGQNTTLFLTEASVDLDVVERIRPYYDANTVGTDLGPDSEAYAAAVAYFSQQPHPSALYIGVRTMTPTPESIVVALAACLAKFQFYGVAIDRAFPDTDATYAANFVQTNIMLYGRSSTDPGILTPGSSTDFASNMMNESRAFVFAREATMTDYPEVAVLSRTTAVDLRIPNSANTIGVQKLESIQPSGFSQTEFNAAVAKNCNIYEIIGPAPVVFPGVMSNGLFIEDQYGIDFLQAYITQLAINGIEAAKRIPQTDAGMNYLVGYLDTGLAQVVASGFLAAGYWDAESIPNVVDNGELLAKGYKIAAAPIKSLTPAQRAAGFGSNIGIALKGSGAIHCLNIYMPLNPQPAKEKQTMKAFSIKSGILQINGALVSGLASGDDVIAFEPYADAVATDFGADGYLEAAVSANQGGKVTVKTQYTSNINSFFQDFYNNQVVGGDLFTPLFGSYRATNGTSVTLAGGVLTKQPKIGLGEKASPCEWEFVFERMIVEQSATAVLAAVGL